eukprot:1728008-Amphidinium_carterae.1
MEGTRDCLYASRHYDLSAQRRATREAFFKRWAAVDYDRMVAYDFVGCESCDGSYSMLQFPPQPPCDQEAVANARQGASVVRMILENHEPPEPTSLRATDVGHAEPRHVTVGERTQLGATQQLPGLSD